MNIYEPGLFRFFNYVDSVTAENALNHDSHKLNVLANFAYSTSPRSWER